MPAGIYTLTLRLALVIDQDLTLTGAGAVDTIIQAYTEGPPLPGLPIFPVFRISFGSIVAISGVTIRHSGLSGVSNDGVLSLTDSTISNNINNNGRGGGISNGGGTVTLTTAQ